MDEHLAISYTGRELTSKCMHLTNSINNVFNLKAKQLSPPRHTRSYVLLKEKNHFKHSFISINVCIVFSSTPIIVHCQCFNQRRNIG